MKKYFLALVIILFSTSLYASNLFTDWRGIGVASHSQGESECSKISVSLSLISESQLRLNKMKWKCGSLVFRAKKRNLDISNGELFKEGTSLKVGTITNSTIHLDYKSSSSSRIYNVKLQLDDEGILSFYKKVTSSDNSSSLEIIGLLTVDN